MSSSDRLAELTAFPFLSNLAEPSRAELARTVAFVEARETRTLIERGDPVGGAYLVLEGTLRVYNLAANGRETTLYWVEPGDSCILAMNCAFRDLRYPAWVENDGIPTRLAVIPPATYRSLFQSEPSVQAFTFEVLSSRIFELMSILEDVSTLDVGQRLAGFLVDKCDEAGVVALSHARIAAGLGTAREVITRNLKRLEGDGLVELGRGTVRVLQPEALAARSDGA